MAPQSREDANLVLQELAKRESEIRKDESSKIDQAFDRAERFVKYAWAFGTVVMSITVWVMTMQFTLFTLRADLNRNADDVREELSRRQIILNGLTAKTTEMWFMKQNGISNKEKFKMDHGSCAPALPE